MTAGVRANLPKTAKTVGKFGEAVQIRHFAKFNADLEEPYATGAKRWPDG